MSRRASWQEKGFHLGGIAFFAAQVASTLTDTSRWPFCAYNMFNRCLPESIEQPRVTLHDDLRSYPMLPVYGLLPLEFFRTVSICGAVYLENDDEALKDRFTERVLRRMNEEPWGSFDEVKASYRPESPAGFTGLDLFEVRIDLADFDPVEGGPLHDAKLLYSYRKAGAA